MRYRAFKKLSRWRWRWRQWDPHQKPYVSVSFAEGIIKVLVCLYQELPCELKNQILSSYTVDLYICFQNADMRYLPLFPRKLR